jgi:uncharacterized protein (DUF1697 family)
MKGIHFSPGEAEVNTFVVLLRGINVGGKNKVPMSALKKCLEDLGCAHVRTYIASGNVILRSDRHAREVQAQIEAALPTRFKLDSDLIRVLVVTRNHFKAVINKKPRGFGEQPGKYHSDVVFLMGIDPAQAMSVFDPREGVDTVWRGNGVIYSQRLSSMRTKSRLNKIMGTPAYKAMTIRSWSTATKLLELVTEK